MDYKYDNCSHVVFSLHDSRIRKISYNNHQLILMVDKLFQYQDNQEKIYAGEVVFNDCSLDECNVLIFNEVIENGDFSGKSISLLEYINNYQSGNLKLLVKDILVMMRFIVAFFGQRAKSLYRRLCIFIVVERLYIGLMTNFNSFIYIKADFYNYFWMVLLVKLFMILKMIKK